MAFKIQIDEEYSDFNMTLWTKEETKAVDAVATGRLNLEYVRATYDGMHL